MSKITSSQKYAIRSKKLKQANSIRKTILRRLIKKMSQAINEKNQNVANVVWLKLQSSLDKFSRKGLIHLNKASRYKSRFYLQIKNII